MKTQGFNIYIQVIDSKGDTLGLLPGGKSLIQAAPYRWEGWTYPRYQSRLKASYSAIRDAFARM